MNTEVQPHLRHIEQGSYAHRYALRFPHKIATNEDRKRFLQIAHESFEIAA
jgi:hypothetical protein